MELEARKSVEDVASEAADLLAATLAVKPDALVVLPAGKTPIPLFRELVRRVEGNELDLSHAHFAQLDEMVGVRPWDPRSFHAFLRVHLLDSIPREPGRDHLIDGGTGAPGLEICRHRARLEALGGVDLVLLGLGGNGHVAFNEPGSGPEDGARVVELAAATRTALSDAFAPEEPPERGMTLGLAEISTARRVVMLVTGASKAQALCGLLGDSSVPELPAAVLRSHPDFRILADEAARSALHTEA